MTTYLADHLLLELKGKGSQYRFQEMLKYLSYVNNTNEFAINEFSHRESMALQAIGYGKLMMTFHMLRNQIFKRFIFARLKEVLQRFLKTAMQVLRKWRKPLKRFQVKNLIGFLVNGSNERVLQNLNC
ncbi:MAG: hypothetical protein CM1200mP16_10970 [Nitrospina sp.]|nr:MAG: hypothetical protein CM1200mP16_10970 [Nitrospina sp.]